MLLVLLYHVGLSLIPGGFIGVDVFFVLSGFLITNHLMAEVSETGRIRFGRFYARRARRLLPASLTVLLVTAVVGGLFVPAVLFRQFVDDLIAATLYVPNILLAIQGTDYLSESAPSPVQHYWSLGVEEQFYLLWPLILMLLVVVTGRRPRRLGTVIVLGVALSLGASIFLTFISQPWAFFSPMTRAWELGAGALVALSMGARWAIGPVASATIAWLGLSGVVVGAVLFSSSTPFPGVAALVPVLGTVAVLLAAPHAKRFGPAIVLGLRPMQFFGRISYSLYLVHWPLLVLPPLIDPAGEPLSLAARVGLGALSIALAWLLHRAIERPFLDSSWARGLLPRTVLVLTAGAMAVVLVTTIAFSAASAQRPLSTATVAEPIQLDDTAVVFSPVVPGNIRPSLSDAALDLPELYADGCHLPLGVDEPVNCVYGSDAAVLDVVLLGDSHAAQWFPAIVGMPTSVSVASHTKSSCPGFTVTVVTNGVADSGCDRWRETVIRGIVANPPDVVILSSFAHYDEYGAPGVTVDTWADAVRSTVARLTAVTEVVVITDTPRFLRSPSICLSASITETSRCDRPREDALDSTWIESERRSARDAGAVVLDLNSFLCDSKTCGTVIGDVLLYRDEHHLSATMSAELAPALMRELALSLPKLFDGLPGAN